MINPGDWVVLATLPPWVDKLPQRSRDVFEHCVGRAFPVDEIDQHGQLVLDVSAEIDPIFGGYMNDIRVEPDYVVPREQWKAR